MQALHSRLSPGGLTRWECQLTEFSSTLPTTPCSSFPCRYICAVVQILEPLIWSAHLRCTGTTAAGHQHGHWPSPDGHQRGADCRRGVGRGERNRWGETSQPATTTTGWRSGRWMHQSTTGISCSSSCPPLMSKKKKNHYFRLHCLLSPLYYFNLGHRGNIFLMSSNIT